MICVPTSAQYRSVDGSGNNPNDANLGKTDTQLMRMMGPMYEDGVSEPRGGWVSSLPSARAVSNAVAAQSTSIFNDRGLSDFTWQWGQFVDHDIDLTDNAEPHEPFNIAVPAGDPWFDPFNTGTQEIGLNRSVYDTATGTGPGDPRRQINQITTWIDASNVYGSDQLRADTLRTFSGGRLATSAGDLLPFNTAGLPNANAGPLPASSMFLAGDVRSNEQVSLTAMHTLFVREHNRLAGEIESANPGMQDEDIYQQARKIVGAQMQAITYNEWLPALLGTGAVPSYSGYDDTVDPRIANSFSTALFRVGHTMLSPTLRRTDNDGNVIPQGNLSLADAFFNPSRITGEGGIDPLLKGMSTQLMQEIDTKVTDAVRNFLFGPPGAGGFDLASLNIQRGRDHGLPTYNELRSQLGLGAKATFEDITSDAGLQAALASVYGSVNEIDLWVGALAEDHVAGSSVGELIQFVLVDQFVRLREGDRFFYLNDGFFTPDLLAEIEAITLADIIRRNTGITNIQDNVFFVPEPASVVLVLLGAGMVWRRRRATA